MGHPLGTADEVVRSYSGLVYHVAKRFKWALSPSLDYSDLVSEGTIGLLKAYKQFDPEKGASFKTYAKRMITWSIQNHLRNFELIGIQVPRSTYELANKLLLYNLEREKPEHVACILSIDKNRVGLALDYLKTELVSLNQPITSETETLTFGEVAAKEEDDHTSIFVREFLVHLPSKERDLVNLLLAGATLREIEKKLGCSWEYSKYLLSMIAERLKRYMEVDKMPSDVLTKERYLELKATKTDKEIRTQFGLTEQKLYHLKKGWGVVGVVKASLNRGDQPEPEEKATARDTNHYYSRLQSDLSEANIRLKKVEQENELLRALVKHLL